MAQYWLEIASADDLSKFAIQFGSGSLTYVLDGVVPALRYSTSDTAVGQYVKWLDVADASDMQVRVLARSTNSAFSGNAVGASARLSARNAYTTSFQTDTAAKRINETSGAPTWYTLIDITAASSGSTASYAWYEIECVGTTLNGRYWANGSERPPSAQLTIVDATLTSGGAGFGRPRNGNNSLIFVSAISVGTDGDPAPDGPVGGGRQRSRLILTPW